MLAGGLLVLLLALSPLGALAANFQDLNPNSPHNTNINLIADAGISKGCGDTAHYCPNAYVSREEMASFLARTAGLGNNPPIANAKTAQTVPDGSVTAAKLSAAGAQTGQVLTATANGVAWQTAAVGNGVAYTHTVVVNSGSDSEQNGITLLDALDGITNASFSNRFLLKIEPGVYDLGNDVLTMKSFVDIEGSGEVVTRIVGKGKAAANTGTIVAAQDSEIRELSIYTSVSGMAAAVSIYSNATNIRIRNLTLMTDGPGSNAYGIFLNGGFAQIHDVNIRVVTGGIGIATVGGTHFITDIVIEGGTTGVQIGNASVLRIFNSYIGGGTNSLLTQAGGSIYVAHTLLYNPVSGTATCVGAFNNQFVELNTSCK